MKIFAGSRKGFLALAVGLAVVIGGGGVALAADSNSNSVTKGNTNRTIYKAGSNVSVTGTVNGDIYCAGQTIIIDAEVNGDVICAGQTITVGGKVNGNVRLAGQTVTVNGQVSRNATIFGQSINLNTNSAIGQDALIFGQTVNLNGSIARDLNVNSMDVNLNGAVGRNVEANVGGKLALQSSANVGGTLVYTGPNMMSKSKSAVVTGPVTYHHTEKKQNNNFNFAGLYIAWRIYLIIALTLFSVVMVALFPQLFRRWNDAPVNDLGWTFLAGLIAVFVLPIAVVTAFVTIVGAPLGLALVFAWLALSMLSFTYAYYYVGSQIFPKMNPVLMILIVSFGFGILQSIPILGFLIVGIAHLLGMGIIAMNLKRLYPKPNYTV